MSNLTTMLVLEHGPSDAVVLAELQFDVKLKIWSCRGSISSSSFLFYCQFCTAFDIYACKILKTLSSVLNLATSNTLLWVYIMPQKCIIILRCLLYYGIKLCVLQVAQELAECISLPDGTIAQLSVARTLAKAEKVNIEPYSEDDWEILESRAELAEETILKQVFFVFF